MFNSFLVALLLSGDPLDGLQRLRDLELSAPPINYYERAPRDRFARLREQIESGRVTLDRSGEKPFLMSLLNALEIPASSQMLVFSTTSLQLSLISPRNPRALYFNEDTYLGFIPGGRIEIVSIDPDWGGMFYIFDVPRASTDAPLAIERSRRCMNCHAGSETGYVPGLVLKSVIPGSRGGSLDAFRVDVTGHSIPLEERFGGWYLTGKHGLTNHLANAFGLGSGRQRLVPGETFTFDSYAARTSDILPQLIHEHQAGFVNRALQAGYLAHLYLEDRPELPPGEAAELDRQANELTRYILFADEAALPPEMAPDAAFIADFRRSRRMDDQGFSLKDFNLENRLFQYRCSYMIYSDLFQALPPAIKTRVYKRLKGALTGEDDAGRHLDADEKEKINRILKSTLAGWRDVIY